jgi:dihydrofolate synthase/folylpolyglutamate synthase
MKVGAYTSPHFLHFNERIRINGSPVADDLLVEALQFVEQRRGSTPQASISLTYFEYTTLAALRLFKQADLDIVVLEVGLGGRLDAVNIIDPDVAIVATVALDHEDYLGSDINVIGFEKAGIFRSGKPAICGDAKVPASVKETALAKGATWYLAGEQFGYREYQDSWSWFGEHNSTRIALDKLSIPELPLVSVSCALQALFCLDIVLKPALLNLSLQKLSLTGRYQRANYKQIPIILDVAHNPAAAHYLADKIRLRENRPVVAVTAIMGNKDLAGIVEPLTPLIKSWYLAPLPLNPRAALPQAVGRELELQGVEQYHYCDSAIDAFESAVAEAQRQAGIVLVFGSFFTVAEILPIL